MSEKEEFEYSSRLLTEEVADYLIQIAEGLRERRLKLQGRGQVITIVPQDTMKLEVQAERKDAKGKLELEISWKEKFTTTQEKLEVTAGNLLEQTVEPVRKNKNKNKDIETE